MKDASSHDVVIAGAGIAGCTAAVLYARAGLRVALIERHADPATFKKACTHYIQPSATRVIERLGLAPAIEAAGGVRNAVDVWTRWGWIRDPGTADGGPSPHGYNIRREWLDPALRALVDATPGVTLLMGHTVAGLVKDGSGRIAGVTVSAAAGEGTIAAKLVVAADGRRSGVAAMASIPTTLTPNGRFFYLAHYRNVPAPAGARSRMWSLEPDVAYAFPNDDGITVLAAIPAMGKLPAFKADLQGSFTAMFESLPDGPDLSRAERVTPFAGYVSLPNEARRVTVPGLALVGDAALALDPLWGTGCGWAFQSAAWLVDRTVEPLRVGGLDAALARYAADHREALAADAWLIQDYATGRPRRPIERLMFSAAARDTQCARHLFRFAARDIRLRQFLAPAALWRAVKVNLARRFRSRTGPLAAGT